MRSQVKQWQDVATLVLAVCLGIAPWVLGFGGESRPMWNAVILGVLIGVAALYALYQSSVWAEAANAVFGTWLLVSPWVLGFSGLVAAMLSAVIVGVAVLALALWRLGRDNQLVWLTPAH